MRYRVRQAAAEFERFAPGCFDNVIGQKVPVDFQGVPLGEGTLVAAEVIEDGRAVWLEFEITDHHVAPAITSDGVVRAFSVQRSE